MARAFLLVAVLAAVALAAVLYLQADGAGRPAAVQANGAEAKAILRNAAGDRVGRVTFEEEEGLVHVRVKVDAPLATLSAGFHGFHVHETGACTPTFAAAGFHLDLADGTGSGGTAHPNEAGDMPVLLVNADGTAEARFTTDRFQIADLLEGDGTALIVHAGRDNYANIPARYLAPPATITAVDQATKDTGDAGARNACGVIEEN